MHLLNNKHAIYAPRLTFLMFLDFIYFYACISEINTWKKNMIEQLYNNLQWRCMNSLQCTFVRMITAIYVILCREKFSSCSDPPIFSYFKIAWHIHNYFFWSTPVCTFAHRHDAPTIGDYVSGHSCEPETLPTTRNYVENIMLGMLAGSR